MLFGGSCQDPTKDSMKKSTTEANSVKFESRCVGAKYCDPSIVHPTPSIPPYRFASEDERDDVDLPSDD